MGWGRVGGAGGSSALHALKPHGFRLWEGWGLQLQLVALALSLFLLCPVIISRARLERCGCGSCGAWCKQG
eukprot:COSAG02_NODE_3218_length_7155_cov_47.006094_2_plen_71_part_00